MQLIDVFRYDVVMLLEELEREIRKYKFNKIVTNPQFLYAQGTIPILLCAHIDTVHNIPPVEFAWGDENRLLWSPQGLGADDRAGVWAILTLLSRGYLPSVLFLDGEEQGGLGAKAAAKSLRTPKVRYIVELDREGRNDCVFYDCYNPKFTKYIESFGFEENYGTFSDISTLCPAWQIAGVNLSVGYYGQHTLGEHLRIPEMEATIDKVQKMLTNVPQKPFFYYAKTYQQRYSTFPRRAYKGITEWGDWDDDVILKRSVVSNYIWPSAITVGDIIEILYDEFNCSSYYGKDALQLLVEMTFTDCKEDLRNEALYGGAYAIAQYIAEMLKEK